MYHYQTSGSAYTLPNDLPPMTSYKELLEARQQRLEEKSRSAGILAALKTLESPSGTQLPPMRPKYQQPTILKKLNYDFGSLNEFLSYDLKLKKPEDLFKGIYILMYKLTSIVTDKSKKLDLKNKEEDLKKGLMQHMKQEVDTRDAKTILIEEKDPEKVSKAAKKFVTDMMGDIFKDELAQLERKLAQKGVNKLHELIMDLDEDNPVRKIAEKYGYKSLIDKFGILEAELEKKKNPGDHLANLKKPRLGIPTKPGQGDSAMHSPLDIGTHSHKQAGVKSPYGNKYNAGHAPMSQNHPNNLSIGQGDNPYMLIGEDLGAYVPYRHTTNPSPPKPKKKEITDNEIMAYAIKILSGSGSMKRVYNEYEGAEKDKEQYAKDAKLAEENAKTKQVDFMALKEREKMASLSSNHMVFQHGDYKPHFYLHVCLRVISFPSLQFLSIRGCDLPEGLVWFILSMVEKYSHNIRMIDISENQISPRICEIIQAILVKHELKSLKMASMDLTSKGLAIVCLGLAKNSSVMAIDFNYNDIDEYGFQTLALILRHTKSLQSVKILKKKVKVMMPNGEEKEVEEELGYTAMAALAKAFKYNKYINPQNVQLFESKPN